MNSCLKQVFNRRYFLQGAAASGIALLVDRQIRGESARAQNIKSADLILTNGRVTTMDRNRPTITAVAIASGKILAVGNDKEILQLRGANTQTINAGGRVVIPGLNDTHSHMVRGGLNYALELRWDGIPTLAEAMDRLKEQIARTPSGQWARVVGGFSPWQFAEQRMPTLKELNEIAPNTPVFILHVYSSALLNRAALQALKIDRNFPNDRYPGGTIERESNSDPTGLLLATPSALILYSTLFDGPKLDTAQQLVSTRHFMREMNRLGVTSTLDCGGGFQAWPEDYSVIQELDRRGELTLRIGFSTFIQRPGKELEDFTRWTQKYQIGEGDEWFYLIGGGEMLVRSAYDFEVFNLPRPELPPNAEADLEAVIRLLAQQQWPFRFHATYNETISRHLNVLEKVHRNTPIDKLHWVVDHGETLTARNIERIKALGGGIAIQNRIAFQEREFLDRYGAEMAANAPPIKKMLEMGVPVGAGTDATRVSSYNPWLCLEWLVTGRGVGGTPLLNSQTKLDRDTALRLWTDNGWFSNEEKIKGRLAPGLYTDLVVLNEDYFSVPEAKIRDLESVLTIVGGKVVWSAQEFAELIKPLPKLQPAWSPVNYYGGFYKRV